ncbi:MAG: sigma-70 family RNA polymerase sigma factor [Deltaproteobacteria bacterium]|nr:sigma-70 family RNA polymerase sigma factor [Deltaproteobacteria bacterium]
MPNPLEWLENHGDVLYRTALLRVGKPDLAEDLVQETLLAAWQARDSFAGKSSESTWLVAILKRKIIDHFRRNWRQVDLPDGMETDDLVGDFKTTGEGVGHWKAERAPAEWGRNPEALLQNSQLKEVLGHCIDQLPESLSAIFVVREIDGMTTAEICKEFSLSPSNLWVILHRARTRLRRCLEKNWFQQTATALNRETNK